MDPTAVRTFRTSDYLLVRAIRADIKPAYCHTPAEPNINGAGDRECH
jgi:hypothetical protein